MTIINPLPYNIANGQAVDATPVQANLNQIVSNVNANAAALAGSPTQVFSVANATTASEAIPLGQAQASFAPIATTGTWTPTIGSASGAFTTVSASGNYVQIGKLWFFNILITITTNGTAAGNVTATFPPGVVSSYTQIAVGKAAGVSGKALIAQTGSTLTITNYDNTYPGSSGEILVITGCIVIN